LDIDSNGDGKGLIKNIATVGRDEHASKSSSMELPIFPTANTGTDTNYESDNKSAKVLPVANFSTNITQRLYPSFHPVY
jgi:PKD repeat protein